MHWLRFAVLLIITAILQAGFINTIAISDIKPDLLLVLLAFFAIFCKRSDAIITSFSIGFAADIIGRTMGPYMISFGLMGCTLAYLNKYISLKTMPSQAIIIFALGLLSGLTAKLLSLLQPNIPYQYTYSVLFAISLYSSIIGPFLFLPIAWSMHIKIHHRRKR